MVVLTILVKPGPGTSMPPPREPAVLPYTVQPVMVMTLPDSTAPPSEAVVLLTNVL